MPPRAIQTRWASVTGFSVSHMRVRVSVLLRGAPAASWLEMAKAPRRTILGASVTVVTPTGQFLLDIRSLAIAWRTDQ